MRALIHAGARLNTQNYMGETALRLAVDTESMPAVKCLLAMGADPNLADWKGWTPLMNATSPEMAHLLVSHGANVKAVTREGATALIVAAQFGTPATVKALLADGADPLVHLSNGKTALDVALDGGKAKNAKLLREATQRRRGQ